MSGGSDFSLNRSYNTLLDAAEEGMAGIRDCPHLISTPVPQGGALFIFSLVQQLANRDTALNAAKAILGVAHAAWADNDLDIHASFVSAGALPPLVELLGAHNMSEVQEAAAGALLALALNDDNKAKIATAGAIPPLVEFLGCQSKARVQMAAAGALSHLAENAKNGSRSPPPVPSLPWWPFGALRRQHRGRWQQPGLCKTSPLMLTTG